MSLLNRLLLGEDERQKASGGHKDKEQQEVDDAVAGGGKTSVRHQSLLYFQLIKSLSATSSMSEQRRTTTHATADAGIASNNEFIMQLELMMAKQQQQQQQQHTSTDENESTSTTNAAESVNYFHMLVKLFVHGNNMDKPSRRRRRRVDATLDSLLLAIFEHIAVRTPGLFASLLNGCSSGGGGGGASVYASRMHTQLLAKLDSTVVVAITSEEEEEEEDGEEEEEERQREESASMQLIAAFAELLSALVRHQPAFVRSLTTNGDDKDNVFKHVFDLVERLDRAHRVAAKRMTTSRGSADMESAVSRHEQTYARAMASVYGVLKTVWSCRKLELMRWCKQRSGAGFWSMVAKTLRMIDTTKRRRRLRGKMHKNTNEDTDDDYGQMIDEYFRYLLIYHFFF